MELRSRHAEVLTSDANLRLAIYDRADHRYQIVEERVRTYESGEAWPPQYVPFPCDAHWQPFWQIDAQARNGVFETVDDALREAKLLVRNRNSTT
jgi:hypothetical protein